MAGVTTDMALRPPNPLLATDTVVLQREADTAGTRGGLTPSGTAVGTYTAIVTKSPSGASRKDDEGTGAPTATLLWDVMLFTTSDPGALVDDNLVVTTQGNRTLKALGPSYPRGAGAWKVECQEVR